MKYLLLFMITLQSFHGSAQRTKHIFKFGVTAGWWRFSPLLSYELFKKRTSLDIQFEAGMPGWRYVRLKPRNVYYDENDGLYHTKEKWYYRDLLFGPYEKGELPARDTKYFGATLSISAKIYLWLNNRQRGWPEGAWFKIGLATAAYEVRDYTLLKQDNGKWIKTPVNNYFKKSSSEFTFGPVLGVGYNFVDKKRNFTFDVGLMCPFYIPVSMFFSDPNSGISHFSILDPMVGSKPFATILIGGDLYDMKKWGKKKKGR